MYQLADRLKKTVHEIMQMPASEFFGWWAYFNLIKPKETS